MSSTVLYQGSNLQVQGSLWLWKVVENGFYFNIQITNCKWFWEKIAFIIQNYQSRLNSHKILLRKISIASLDHAFTNQNVSKLEY